MLVKSSSVNARTGARPGGRRVTGGPDAISNNPVPVHPHPESFLYDKACEKSQWVLGLRVGIGKVWNMKNVALFSVVVSFALLVLADCAHAQQGNWPIPRSAYRVDRTPDPAPTVRSEAPITTMAQARRQGRN